VLLRDINDLFFFTIKLIIVDEQKKSRKEKSGTKPKPFQKVENLKLGIPNLFLLYSPLMESGKLSDENKSEEVNERPIFARLSAQVLPSLKICDTKNLICLILYIQLSHLFLIIQGPIEEELKAKVTNCESVSNQK